MGRKVNSAGNTCIFTRFSYIIRTASIPVITWNTNIPHAIIFLREKNFPKLYYVVLINLCISSKPICIYEAPLYLQLPLNRQNLANIGLIVCTEHTNVKIFTLKACYHVRKSFWFFFLSSYTVHRFSKIFRTVKYMHTDETSVKLLSHLNRNSV